MSSTEPYNPLAKRNLGKSVADALLQSEPDPLGTLTNFDGAGIYALYYTGAFPIYAPIANRNRKGKFELPIYVGKAVPKGARKGDIGLGLDPGTALFTRLVKDHAKSIKQAENLDIEDFFLPLPRSGRHLDSAW
ncbi:Eco29kI family restriction endonuclease [Roseospirillum parvum]|uniref:Eco29kI family restriction endonuclease n=1 Tax=Roseospirillum parvum TaxID=83401 RepID=UPI001C409D91|nr:Eco29kI family restriction endonuclease [Roseospirillum parvum]